MSTTTANLDFAESSWLGQPAASVMVGTAPGDWENRELYANFPLDSEVPYWDEA